MCTQLTCYGSMQDTEIIMCTYIYFNNQYFIEGIIYSYTRKTRDVMCGVPDAILHVLRMRSTC